MSRLRLRLRPTVTVKTTVRGRPPQQFVQMLGEPETAFKNYVRDLESSHLFRSLLDNGFVSRIGLRGRVPREKYQEFMDREFGRFLDDTGIRSKQGWEADLFSPDAIRRVPEIAEKYSVPAGRIERFVRYFRNVHRDVETDSYRPASASDDEGGDLIESSPTQDTGIDLSDITQMLASFVGKHGISQQEFIDVVLRMDLSSEDLSARFGCTRAEAEEMMDALNEFHIVEMLEEGSTRVASVSPPLVAASDEPIANVRIQEDRRVVVEVPPDSMYAVRYRIVERTDNLSEEGKALITALRSINHRASILTRLLTVLCNYQREFLATGDMNRLKPLAQAEMARRIDEPRSTVNRILRGKSILTDRGLVRLHELFPSKTDVIARVVHSNPDRSDNEIRMILQEKYDCVIARRTVAYHRKRSDKVTSRPVD